MGESANILRESMTVVILGGLVVLLAAVLAMENWLRAWEQRVPSPLARLVERAGVEPQRLDSPRARRDVALAQQSCPQCAFVAPCRAWIESGRTQGYGDFCPNAALVERLAERRRP